MSSSVFPSRTLAAVAVAALGGLVGAAPADAQSFDEPDIHHIIRADVGLELVNRTFELEGPSEVLFDSPYYPGLRVHLELYPVAIFDPTHAAAGLGFVFETSKHTINTVAAVELDGEFYDLDVPTRHDVTHLGLQYEWGVSDKLTVTPAIAWHTVEYGLGFNSLYRNSFYKGVEISARGDYEVGIDGLTIGLAARVRPAVNLGSTVEPYGSTASSFAFGIDAGLRYFSEIGIYGVAELRYERYATTYRPDRNENRDDSTSTDRFQSFLFALGYAY